MVENFHYEKGAPDCVKYKDYTNTFLLHESEDYEPREADKDEEQNGKLVFLNLFILVDEGVKKFKVIEKV
jgi:hypothetical protein